MLNDKKKPKVESRRLRNLKPHPQQDAFFDPLDDVTLQALAEDIERNGLRDNIEVLPKNSAGLAPNTIVSGHQRRRALQLLNKDKIDVLVRYDLADASRDEIDRAFLEQNLNRRQLDPLAKARAVLRIYEAQRGKKVNRENWWDMDDARDYVGKMIGMSGRNLQRYFHVLNTPVEMQNALRAGKVKLVDAEKVAHLQSGQKAEIAGRIRAGEDPRLVISELVRPVQPRVKSTPKVVATAMKQLRAFAGAVEGRLDHIRGSRWLHLLPDLQQAKKIIDQLIDQLNHAAADDAAAEAQQQDVTAACKAIIRRQE